MSVNLPKAWYKMNLNLFTRKTFGRQLNAKNFESTLKPTSNSSAAAVTADKATTTAPVASKA